MNPAVITTKDENYPYIHIKFIGDLVTERYEDFKKGLMEASDIIEKTANEGHGKVKIMLDLTEFSGNYSLSSLNLLVDFAKSNVPYVERTASFGGSDKVNMAGEIAVVLSGRDNIKVCKTKEEAISFII
jgi:hypothetical protein